MRPKKSNTTPLGGRMAMRTSIHYKFFDERLEIYPWFNLRCKASGAA